MTHTAKIRFPHKSVGRSLAFTLAALVVGSCSETNSEPASGNEIFTPTFSEPEGGQQSQSDGTGAVPAPQTSASVGGSSLEPSVLNLEELGLLTASENRIVFGARESLVAKCMKERGFEYQVVPVPELPSSSLALYPEPELIAQYGYGWRAARVTFSDDSIPEGSDQPGFIDALNGTSDQIGCGQAAGDGIGLQEWFLSRQDLANEQAILETRVELDARFPPVLSAWSECMASFGFRFENPRLAEESAQTVDSADDSGIQLAVSDFECRRQVGYAETKNLIRSDLVALWIEENAGLLEQLADAKAAVVDRASSGG